MPTLASLAAILYAALTAGVVAFQVALALGAPWGAYAMGGALPGRFPPRLRVAAVSQAVVLAGLALGVLSRAAVVRPELTSGTPWLIWVAVAISVVATVLNAITPSTRERRIWLPVTIGLLLTSLTVALAT